MAEIDLGCNRSQKLAKCVKETPLDSTLQREN
jgi:hypothetical protein